MDLCTKTDGFRRNSDAFVFKNDDFNGNIKVEVLRAFGIILNLPIAVRFYTLDHDLIL